jgi:hypothetical protein
MLPLLLSILVSVPIILLTSSLINQDSSFPYSEQLLHAATATATQHLGFFSHRTSNIFDHDRQLIPEF